ESIARDELVYGRFSDVVGPAKPALSVLAALGDPTQYGRVVDWIRHRGQVVNIVTTGSEALRVHQLHGADLVLVGLPLPDRAARALLAQLRGQDPHVTIAVAGVDADVTSAVDAFDLGARVYAHDPISDVDELVAGLGLALGVRKGDAQLRYLRRKD